MRDPHCHVLELVDIISGGCGVITDCHGRPYMSDCGHTGGKADAECRSHHDHISGFAALLHTEYLEDILKEGHKCNEQNRRGYE